jgi:hypothetical protein
MGVIFKGRQKDQDFDGGIGKNDHEKSWKVEGQR